MVKVSKGDSLETRSNDWLTVTIEQDADHRWWVRWYIGRDGSIQRRGAIEVSPVVSPLLFWRRRRSTKPSRPAGQRERPQIGADERDLL